MTRLEINHAQAIRRLSSNSDFHVFLEWVAASLAEADAANRLLEGAQLYRSQGKAVTLADIIGAPERADKALARSRA